MAGTVQLSAMRTRARTRADMTGSGFISDAEIDVFLNDGIRRLYHLLVETHESYFESEDTINVVSGTEDYALPADFMRVLDLDMLVSGTEYQSVLPAGRWHRNSSFSEQFHNARNVASLRYMLRGDNVRFVPTPTQAETVRLRYVPVMSDLSGDSAVMAHLIMDQWVQFPVVYAARKMLLKEESDVAELNAELGELKARIRRSTLQRDPEAPRQVQVIRNSGLVNPYDDPFERW